MELTAIATPPPPDPGNWVVDDEGSQNLATNITVAKDYRVKNLGPDAWVAVQVYNSDDELIETVSISNGTSTDVGVPAGGDLKVVDPSDTNSDGAHGTYKIV